MKGVPCGLNQRSRMCSIRNLTKLFAKRGKANGKKRALKPHDVLVIVILTYGKI